MRGHGWPKQSCEAKVLVHHGCHVSPGRGICEDGHVVVWGTTAARSSGLSQSGTRSLEDGEARETVVVARRMRRKIARVESR